MNFTKKYTPDKYKVVNSGVKTLAPLEAGSPGITEFFAEYGGISFNKGIYRLLSPSSCKKWTATIANYFPDFRSRAFCFGCDWLGRFFALDRLRQEGGQWQVLMFELGMDNVAEIPCNFPDFHNREIIRYADEALATKFHARWLRSGGVVPTPSQCIGYVLPPFLGGEDDIANLEAIDMDVYWNVVGQLLVKARTLPEGATLDDIALEEPPTSKRKKK